LDIGDLLSAVGCVFQRRLTDFIAAASNASPVEAAVGKTRLGLEFRRLHVEHRNPLVPWSNLILQRLQLDRAFREPGLDSFDLQFRVIRRLALFCFLRRRLSFHVASLCLFISPSLGKRFVIVSRGSNERIDAPHPDERILSRQYFFDLIFIGLPHRQLIPGSSATANSIGCVSPASFLAERLNKLA
jgi:hypothetical protein